MTIPHALKFFSYCLPLDISGPAEMDLVLILEREKQQQRFFEAYNEPVRIGSRLCENPVDDIILSLNRRGK
jgi:hypothetical protein